MNSELLYTDSSFGWLANEINIAQVRRDAEVPAQDRAELPALDRTEVPAQVKVLPFEEVRLPADFSVDRAILKAKHLRALQLGEFLGSFARSLSDSISRIGQGLTNLRNPFGVARLANFDTGTRHESQRKLREAFLEA